MRPGGADPPKALHLPGDRTGGGLIQEKARGHSSATQTRNDGDQRQGKVSRHILNPQFLSPHPRPPGATWGPKTQGRAPGAHAALQRGPLPCAPGPGPLESISVALDPRRAPYLTRRT